MPQLELRAPTARKSFGVRARHSERVERHVGADDAGESSLVRERERDRTRTSADIDRHAAAFVSREIEYDLDELLRFGTRNEHALIDVQREVAKGRATGGVRERCASRAFRGGTTGRVALRGWRTAPVRRRSRGLSP